MNKIKVYDLKGNQVNEIEINKELLVDKIANQAIFDSIIAERASQRQGTHSTLTKGEVSGGGRKPYKQKHTGRARQGSIRNPHYVGGGIAFGPKPNRNYEIKVNKKVSDLAFKSALTTKVKSDLVLGLIDDANLEKPSTKAITDFLKKIACENKKVLIITTNKNENLCKSSNNIPKVTLKNWNQVSVQDLLLVDTLLIQPEVLKKWLERGK